MYAQHRLFIMILFSSLLWVSCGPAQLCTPQQTATCTCPDNKTSTKTCSDDGTQYSDCACSSNEPSPEQTPEQTKDASTKEEHMRNRSKFVHPDKIGRMVLQAGFLRQAHSQPVQGRCQTNCDSASDNICEKN